MVRSLLTTEHLQNKSSSTAPGMVRQWLPAGEARVQIVPVRHLGFTEPPAEKTSRPSMML